MIAKQDVSGLKGLGFNQLQRQLAFYAARKNHIGFYPIPSGIAAFKRELAPYKQAKGSEQFPLDKPIPFDLVKKIVKYRAKEISDRR